MKPDITGIRKRLEAATQSKWIDNGHCQVTYEGDGTICHTMAYGDAELIASAPTDIASLLAYVSELEGQLRVVAKTLGRIASSPEITSGGIKYDAGVAYHLIDERFKT